MFFLARLEAFFPRQCLYVNATTRNHFARSDTLSYSDLCAS
jgi:hypothetical protein